MKNFTLIALMGIVATTTAMAIESAPASAANLSLTGTFGTNPDATPSYTFTADGTSNVTIRSYSWGGGINAAGTVISAGGFDPILTLFNDTTGAFFTEQEDIGPSLDFQLSQILPAGNYRAVISAFANYAVGPNYVNGFTGGGDFFGRTSNYAFDILNVNNLAVTAVPEPDNLVGIIAAGFSVVMFNRKLSSSKK
jgi:hypothetical protein